MSIAASTIRLAASLLLAGATVALADPALAAVAERHQAIVRTADLDLGTVAGRAVALGRIDAAARRTCADENSAPAVRACVGRAAAGGRAALDRLAPPVFAAR